MGIYFGGTDVHRIQFPQQFDRKKRIEEGRDALLHFVCSVTQNVKPEETLKIFIAPLLLVASTLAFGQSPAVQTWNPEKIVWQRTDSDGTKWAVLEGDKDAPGKAFTYAFFLPAGHWEHHFHNQDARVAVVSGALKVAVGPELDKTGAKTYQVGSFLYVPANVQHTMGADVDTICIGTAVGPWKTHYEHEMNHH